jgi:hypothetical protein
MTRQKSKSSETDAAHEREDEENAALASSTIGLLRDRARPLLERATEMLQRRPYLTVGAAVGAGFLLGVSVVGRFGRLIVLGVASLGADLLREAARAKLTETSAHTRAPA